jgi:hypothetical protein
LAAIVDYSNFGQLLPRNRVIRQQRPDDRISGERKQNSRAESRSAQVQQAMPMGDIEMPLFAYRTESLTCQK